MWGRGGRRQGRYRGQNRRRFRLRHRPSPDKSARSDAGGGGGPKPAEVSPTTHDLPSVTVFGEEKYVVYWNMTKPPDWGSLVQPPVELASTRKVPVEPVVLKRKAKSPLEPRQQPRRSDPPSPTRWELARTKVKERFQNYITPLLEDMADLPVEPPSRGWQEIPKRMGRVNIRITDEGGARLMLVFTLLHQEFYQQVHIDKKVDSDTCHCLLKSVFGPNYGVLLPSLTSLLKRCPWLQLREL